MDQTSRHCTRLSRLEPMRAATDAEDRYRPGRRTRVVLPGRKSTSNVREAPLTGHRVLVVDDNQMVANCVGGSLKLLGAEVRVACCAASALRCCEHWQPSTALVDLLMPSMNGWELAGEMRARFPGSACRLIALSGTELNERSYRAEDAAFDLHVVKPVRLDELVGAIGGTTDPR